MSACLFMLDPTVFEAMSDNELSDKIKTYEERLKDKPTATYGFKVDQYGGLLSNYMMALIEQKFRVTHIYDAGGNSDMPEDFQLKLRQAYCYGFIHAKLNR